MSPKDPGAAGLMVKGFTILPCTGILQNRAPVLCVCVLHWVLRKNQGCCSQSTQSHPMTIVLTELQKVVLGLIWSSQKCMFLFKCHTVASLTEPAQEDIMATLTAVGLLQISYHAHL